MFSFFKIRFTVFRSVLSLRPFVCGCKNNNKFYNTQYSFNKMFSFPNNHEHPRRAVRLFQQDRAWLLPAISGIFIFPDNQNHNILHPKIRKRY